MNLDLRSLFTEDSPSLMALLDVEGEVTGKVEKEVEHVFYGMVPVEHLVDLAKQPYVKTMLQEQFTMQVVFDKNKPEVYTQLRVRRVNREKSVLTAKQRTPEMEGQYERSVEIPNEVFEFIAHICGTGIMKMRFTIQPASYPKKLELDVFLDKTGNIPTSGTVAAKYDYEVDSAEDPVPQLPIPLINMVHFNPFTVDQNPQSVGQLREFMQRQGFRI